MKRLNLIPFLAVLAVLFSFTACGDDDDDKEETVSEQYAGVYKATSHLNVGGSTEADYNADSEEESSYIITANSNGTISVTVPKESYKGLFAVGDITVGSYTIDNIPWDETKKAFYLKYGSEGKTCHFTSSTMNLDTDYTLSDDACEITVRKSSSNGMMNISNTYKMGRMPVTIYVTFSGTK